MEMYDVEAFHVKQKKILHEISEYVRGEALNKDMYSVESDLFQYMLRMGREFLGEVISRHGTGKTDGSIKVGDKRLPYHTAAYFQECSLNRVDSDKPQKASQLQQSEAHNAQHPYQTETSLQGK